MRPTILLLLLTACGPDLSGVVASHAVEGLTILSEVPLAVDKPGQREALSTTWIDVSVRHAKKVLDANGIVPAADFAERFGGLTVVVRERVCLRETTTACVEGKTSGVWPGPASVELGRHGVSLGHELLHVVGGEGHGPDGIWREPEFREAQRGMNVNWIQWDI